MFKGMNLYLNVYHHVKDNYTKLYSSKFVKKKH